MANKLIGVGTTIVGFEDICKKEIESLGAKNVKTNKGFITFEVKNALELSAIAYKSQTTSRIFSLLSELVIEDDIFKIEKVLKTSLDKIEFKDFIKKDTTFKVECDRCGEHSFTGSNIESLLGRLIIENIKDKQEFSPRVFMDNPDSIIFVHVRDDKLVFGIDFCGFDASKRDYHIFINKVAIKGTVGACLALYAGLKPNEVMLDTFSSSGTIVIESAFINEGRSPNFFRKEEFIFRRLDLLKKTKFEAFFKKLDKKVINKKFRIIATDPMLSNVRATSKNAKIADVLKNIEVKRADIEWIDTKIDKASVDVIITRLTSVSRTQSEKDVLKIYKEFFYQTEYILKKKGRIILLLYNEELMLKIAKEYKFKEYDIREIVIGKLPLKVVALKM